MNLFHLASLEILLLAALARVLRDEYRPAVTAAYIGVAMVFFFAVASASAYFASLPDAHFVLP